MIPLGPCEITGAFGPMCSGKTYLIGEWLRENNRYVRFDATGETCEDTGVEHVWGSPLQLYKRLQANPYFFRISYHPGTDLEEDFFHVVRCLWRINVFKTIVCDEFHEVCSVNETPKYVRTMLRYARHNHLAVIGASQRIADVHKLFTSGCRQTILFWTQEARDLDAIGDRWGDDCAEMVNKLRPLIFDDETKQTKQVPQCVVIVRGSQPRIYDFAEECFIGEGSSDSATPSQEVQREDNSSVEDSSGGEGGDVSELPTSDPEPPSPEGSV